MTELYGYQKKGVRKIEHFKGRALLADDMGLGKTLQTLKWLHEKKAFPAIVVCPASVKYNWEREAKRHLGLTSTVLEGRTPPKRGFNIKQPLIIINYRILQHWLKYLTDMNAKTLILDECHAIKNSATNQYKAAYELSEEMKHVVALSGTPLTNRPSELWPTLNILRPDIFDSFQEFAWEYCQPKRAPWGWQYNGASNIPELHEKLNTTCMIRRRKVDVLHELPDKTRHIVPLTISKKDMKEYRTAENEFIEWLARQDKKKAERAERAEKLVKAGYLKRLIASLKLTAVFDWIDSFLKETDEKLIVFGIHKSILESLKKRYKKISVSITGATSAKKRQLAVDQFQNKKSVRLFLGNINSAGAGITLTAASTVLFTEFSWVPGDHLQAESRPHRIGQTNAVQCFYVVVPKTIEEKLCKILQEKQIILDGVLDGKLEASVSLDVWSQLEKELRVKV